LKSGQFQYRLGARRLQFGIGNAVEDDLERDKRAVGTECLQRARMQLAEVTENVLRPNLDGAGTARMEPIGAARHDLQCLHRRARRCEYRKSVGLAFEYALLCYAQYGRLTWVRPVSTRSK
jgi:hypothetical protein